MTSRDPQFEQVLDAILASAPDPVPAGDLARRIVVRSVTMPQIGVANAPPRRQVAAAIRTAVPRLLLRSPLGGAIAASLILTLVLPWHSNTPDQPREAAPVHAIAAVEAAMNRPIPGIAMTAERQTGSARHARSAGAEDARSGKSDVATKPAYLAGSVSNDSLALAIEDVPGLSPEPVADFKLAAKEPPPPTVYGPVLSEEGQLSPVYTSSSTAPLAGLAIAPSR